MTDLAALRDEIAAALIPHMDGYLGTLGRDEKGELWMSPYAAADVVVPVVRAHIDALTAKVEALPPWDNYHEEAVSRAAVLAILRGEA